VCSAKFVVNTLAFPEFIFLKLLTFIVALQFPGILPDAPHLGKWGLPSFCGQLLALRDAPQSPEQTLPDGHQSLLTYWAKSVRPSAVTRPGVQ
jgi:hypothetical protein